MEETKNCPYCGEEILATAKKCKHCSEWLEQNDGSIDNANLQKTFRSAHEEATWNEENSGALPVQIGIIAIALGFVFKSWWVGLGVFVGLGVLLMIPYVGTLVCLLLSIMYAYIGYVAGSYLFGTSAGWVIAILVGIGSLGINFSSRDWLKDF
ncbi:MAG: hypothetical protein IKS94_00400 [Prevotella sp.]|nr:hypothetical protein [Prevotella sp.]